MNQVIGMRLNIPRRQNLCFCVRNQEMKRSSGRDFA